MNKMYHVLLLSPSFHYSPSPSFLPPVYIPLSLSCALALSLSLSLTLSLPMIYIRTRLETVQ